MSLERNFDANGSHVAQTDRAGMDGRTGTLGAAEDRLTAQRTERILDPSTGGVDPNPPECVDQDRWPNRRVGGRLELHHCFACGLDNHPAFVRIGECSMCRWAP